MIDGTAEEQQMNTPSDPTGRRRLSTSMRAALIAIPVVVLVVVVAIAVSILSRPPAPKPSASAPASASSTVESDSHVLDDGGAGAPTLVEFLDFECEACGAFYPYGEDVRKQYDGKLTYVIRYFPMPGHRNSMTAAVAVEAAAQQGKFEEMYRKMFETQAEWGEKQASEAPRFRGYAQELGLDLTAYDAAVADSRTQERVQKDFDAARALGATGTPTFFLDGRKLELTSVTDLTDALDRALAAKSGS